MKNKQKTTYLQPIESILLTIRDRRVILAADLARIYGVKTKVLNQAVKRNHDKFPEDFMFQLSREEAESLRRSRSQSVTLKRGQNIKYLPYAFTEHGALMAANVLESPRAVKMSVFVVRAFIKMREQLLSRAELESRLAQIENILLSHDGQIRDLYDKIRPLLLPLPVPPGRRIGFTAREKFEKYSFKRKKQSNGKR